MLEHTFCHVPGVGPTTEKRWWASGVRTWADVERAGLKGARRDLVCEWLDRSRASLDAGDARYFGRALPQREQWRLFPAFQPKVAYLDIETTGLGAWDDHVTCIAVYDGTQVRHYVHGQNLDRFEADMAGYDLLVTYNGKGFDVPMIRRMMGVELDQAHIDLMHVLRGIGLKGGLKAIERRLGYDRADMADVDGFFAVLLWREYERTGDDAVLETLLAYNVQDVLTLEPLMVHVFNEKLRETPFFELTLPMPRLAENPFSAHREVIDRVRWRALAG